MIEFHADDYGLFWEESKRIIDCIENGVLNGVSIMPNSPDLKECMDMLEPYRDRMALTVHLNLVEGHCLSRSEDVDLLVNEDGNFQISFGKLLAVSFLPSKKAYMAQIEEELRRQIEIARPYFGELPLRLDSHVHYHQLPVVFDSIADMIQKEDLKVSYIRMPKECFRNYRPFSKISGRKGINLIKVLILNILTARNFRKHKGLLDQMKHKDFSGVLCSGNMCYENAKRVLTNWRKRPENEGRDLELLFHPGAVLEPEDQKKLTSRDDLTFLTHEGRMREAAALRRLKEDGGK